MNHEEMSTINIIDSREYLGLRRTIKSVLYTFVCLFFIPILGVFLIIHAATNSPVSINTPTPAGYIYKKCPDCGHYYTDSELSSYRGIEVSTIKYKCSVCDLLTEAFV